MLGGGHVSVMGLEGRLRHPVAVWSGSLAPPTETVPPLFVTSIVGVPSCPLWKSRLGSAEISALLLLLVASHGRWVLWALAGREDFFSAYTKINSTKAAEPRT